MCIRDSYQNALFLKHGCTDRDRSPAEDGDGGVLRTSTNAQVHRRHDTCKSPRCLRSSKLKLYCVITHMSRERALDLIAQKYRTLDIRAGVHVAHPRLHDVCLLYTSDAADE